MVRKIGMKLPLSVFCEFLILRIDGLQQGGLTLFGAGGGYVPPPCVNSGIVKNSILALDFFGIDF